jgi:hypothetical protein
MATTATERSRVLRERRAHGEVVPFGIDECRDDRSGNSRPGRGIGVGVMPRGTDGQVKVVKARSVGDRRRRRDRFFLGLTSKPVLMCGPFPSGSWRDRRPSLLGLAP